MTGINASRRTFADEPYTLHRATELPRRAGGNLHSRVAVL